jgi:regulator of protease activity HflC (stomatin/prohibitin superfamily)
MTSAGLKTILISVMVFIGFIVILSTATTVDEQEIGVVTKFGKVEGTIDAGFHFINPLTTNVVKMSLEVEALPLEELAYSKDAQIVGVQALVNYRLVRADAVKVFTDVRQDYESRYVLPEARDAIKAVLSTYTAQELIDSRSGIPLEVKERLNSEVSEYGIEITNVAIENFDFDDEYERAVTNKQVQEQEALTQANYTAQEEEKKKQQILIAEAQAEKTRLEAQALASQSGSAVIEKIYAEAQLELAKNWNGQMPTHMYSGSPFPIINTPE